MGYRMVPALCPLPITHLPIIFEETPGENGAVKCYDTVLICYSPG